MVILLLIIIIRTDNRAFLRYFFFLFAPFREHFLIRRVKKHSCRHGKSQKFRCRQQIRHDLSPRVRYTIRISLTNVTVMSSAQILLTIYATGGLFSFILTFFLTKDPNPFFRLLSCLLIALTWPMSLPVVILFSLF